LVDEVHREGEGTMRIATYDGMCEIRTVDAAASFENDLLSTGIRAVVRCRK
jgi:hypothetical protein